MRVLVSTGRIKTLIDGREKPTCDLASMSAANWDLKLYKAVLLYKTITETDTWRPSTAWCSETAMEVRSWRRTTAQYSQLAGAGPADGDWLPGGGGFAQPGDCANSQPARHGGLTRGGPANVFPSWFGT